VRRTWAKKKLKFTEEQIAFALRQAEAGTPVPNIARKLGISEVTFYRWKKRFGGMGVAAVRRLRRSRRRTASSSSRWPTSLTRIPPVQCLG
jgi:transposase